jgi:UvrD-like helicase C-terminal domain
MEHLGDWTRALLEQEGRGGGRPEHDPGAAGLLDGVPAYRLFDNCRNTRSIHAVARAMAEDETVAIGPDGRAPEFIVVEEAGEPARLAEVVTRLVRDEGVRPEQIAVVTAARRRLRPLAPFGRIGEYPVTDDTAGVPGHVLLKTIHRFKGLERPVVVLAGLRQPAVHVDPAKLLYVGVTRAQAHSRQPARETGRALRRGDLQMRPAHSMTLPMRTWSHLSQQPCASLM